MNSIVRSISTDAVVAKTYLHTAIFVAANILLPQLFHVAGLGGAVFIPILFFTLLAGVRYGLLCGLATAIISPLISHLIMGMPALPMLSVLMIKGVSMAFAAYFILNRTQNLKLYHIALIAVVAQIIGGVFQSIFFGGVAAAYDVVYTALPGIVLQIVAVWAILKIARK